MSDIEDACAAMCDGMNGKAKLLLTGLSRVTIDVAERLSCDKELEMSVPLMETGRKSWLRLCEMTNFMVLD